MPPCIMSHSINNMFWIKKELESKIRSKISLAFGLTLSHSLWLNWPAGLNYPAYKSIPNKGAFKHSQWSPWFFFVDDIDFVVAT